MAYCPNCKQNVQLIVTHDTYSDSTPRCSNCYGEIKFPQIQSESEYKTYTDKLDQQIIRNKIRSIEYELPFLQQAVNKEIAAPFNYVGFIWGVVSAGLAVYFYHKFEILPDIVTNYLYIFFDFIIMVLFGIAALVLFLTCFSSSNHKEALQKQKEAKERLETRTKELEALNQSLK